MDDVDALAVCVGCGVDGYRRWERVPRRVLLGDEPSHQVGRESRVRYGADCGDPALTVFAGHHCGESPKCGWSYPMITFAPSLINPSIQSVAAAPSDSRIASVSATTGSASLRLENSW
jgi:hypothetical protein